MGVIPSLVHPPPRTQQIYNWIFPISDTRGINKHFSLWSYFTALGKALWFTLPIKMGIQACSDGFWQHRILRCYRLSHPPTVSTRKCYVYNPCFNMQPTQKKEGEVSESRNKEKLAPRPEELKPWTPLGLQSLLWHEDGGWSVNLHAGTGDMMLKDKAEMELPAQSHEPYNWNSLTHHWNRN